ncbi:MAG: hypothetical protein IJN68_04355 [Clostridia bacterium]|nr:hypothetical protein [Clostridia bacterium]
MITLKNRKFLNKILSVFLSVIILALSVAPVGLAAVSFPPGVTPEQSQAAMKQTDYVLKALAESAEGKPLSDVVLSMLFSDATLSSLAKMMYSLGEDNAETFSAIGLNFTPAAISDYLDDYPDVQYRLASADSWANVSLDDVSWGVETTAEFTDAAVALLTPMNDLLYTILCAGSYNVNNLVGLKGAKGYANSLVRIYIKCGMDAYTPADAFESQAAADKSSMVRNIIADLARYIVRICSAPATMLSTKLPGIAYFIHTGGLDAAISRLIEPLRIKIMGITTPIKIGSITDLAAESQQGVSFDFNLSLNSLTASGTLELAPFDLATLASLAFDDVDTYIVDTASSFMYILRWLMETVKLNANNIPSMLSDMTGGETSAELQNILSTFLSKSTDELITIYIGLLSQTQGMINPYTWTFSTITPAEITYTPNLGQEKYQRVLDGIDALINQFVKEGGEAETLRASLQPQIYSNKVLTELTAGIYGIFSGEEMGSLMNLAGLDLTPAGLAKALKEDKYASVRETLGTVKNFEEFKTKTVNWGFKDGSKNGWGKALCAIFRPMEPVLRMLLCADKADIFGAVPFYGSDGYNTAVIPLLEALGCTFDEIRTYDEFIAQTKSGDLMIPIAKALLSLIERMLDYPVYTITGILPNLMYFLNNGGLQTCITNLIYPVKVTLESLGLSDMLDLSKITESINPDELISGLTEGLNLDINLPQLDIKQFGNIGTLVPAQTKRTQNGQPMTIQYLQADRTGVLITLLRYLVEIIKTPGNEGLVDSFMNTSGEGNDMFATYGADIGNELAAMSTDETVEWLYKIFFRERATVEQSDTDYTPTVIYEENTSINWTPIIVGVAVFVALALIVAMLNRDKIRDLIASAKDKKSPKEDN